jgi:hypothetical protein
MFRAKITIGKYEYFIVHLSVHVEVMFRPYLQIGEDCKGLLRTLGAVMNIAAMQCMSETGVS